MVIIVDAFSMLPTIYKRPRRYIYSPPIPPSAECQVSVEWASSDFRVSVDGHSTSLGGHSTGNRTSLAGHSADTRRSLDGQSTLTRHSTLGTWWDLWCTLFSECLADENPLQPAFIVTPMLQFWRMSIEIHGKFLLGRLLLSTLIFLGL